MLSDQDVVWRDWWFFPDVLGTWVERPAVDHVGSFSQERPSLLFSKRLVLVHTVEGLSDGLDKRFDNLVLVTCVWGVPLPLEIAGKFLCDGTLYLGNVPALHHLPQVFLCFNKV